MQNTIGFPTSCSKSLGFVCNGAGNVAGPAGLSSRGRDRIVSDWTDEEATKAKVSGDGPPERSPKSGRALFKSVESWRNIVVATGVSDTLGASDWVPVLGGFCVGGSGGRWKVVFCWVGVGGGGSCWYMGGL